MTAPFAELESRVNAAVFARLANASAVLDNVAVEGIFDNEFEIVLDGIETRAPAFTLPTASCRRATQSSLLRIAEGEHIGNRYRVRSVQPDGTGVTVLVLELLP